MRPLAPRAGIALGAVLAASCAALASCGGGTPKDTMAPLPAPVTRATLAGPQCEVEETACRCREPGEDAGLPAPGFKRYELRLGPASNPLWAEVGDMVFYKSQERSEECYYFDLRPGEYSVRLRAESPRGFGARMSLSEYGDSAKSWYDTFYFDCGSPGDCRDTDLEDWDLSVRERKGRLHDPCGSTKVRSLEWMHGRLQDQVHPDSLQLGFVLDVYRFIPEHPTGDPACADAH